MVGIPLSELKKKELIAHPSVEWSKKLLTIKRQSFPKGATPPHLIGYIFKKDGIPRECADRTNGLSGEARVRAMNSCVREIKGKIPETPVKVE